MQFYCASEYVVIVDVHTRPSPTRVDRTPTAPRTATGERAPTIERPIAWECSARRPTVIIRERGGPFGLVHVHLRQLDGAHKPVQWDPFWHRDLDGAPVFGGGPFDPNDVSDEAK